MHCKLPFILIRLWWPFLVQIVKKNKYQTRKKLFRIFFQGVARMVLKRCKITTITFNFIYHRDLWCEWISSSFRFSNAPRSCEIISFEYPTPVFAIHYTLEIFFLSLRCTEFVITSWMRYLCAFFSNNFFNTNWIGSKTGINVEIRCDMSYSSFFQHYLVWFVSFRICCISITVLVFRFFTIPDICYKYLQLKICHSHKNA